MRSRATTATTLAVALFFGATVFGLACAGDPNDPHTWAAKLKDLRERKEALDHIANMDVERARAVVPDLMALYQETKSPEHLQALARYKDERTKPLMLDALDFTDEDFDRAIIAAGVLGDMKATDAVDKLAAAAEKPIPIKSRANGVRVEAIRALVKIGDKRAVPSLIKVLETSADEQDFALNQKAALGLAELRDPQAVPALIKGLFMTGRGADIFQECRLALVRIGSPAIDPLIQLFQDKNADVREMAQKYQFKPGIIQFKAAWVLGDLRAAKAVPVLVAYLGGKPRGVEFNEQSTIAVALGQIATPGAVDALIALAGNAKADFKVRLSATDALYMAGDKRALPVLFGLAKSGDVVVEGQKTGLLRGNAAIDFARLAGGDQYPALKALAEKETEQEGMFGEALDRLQVAKDCGTTSACYVKTLGDPSPARAEKAAFALAFSGDKSAVPRLLAALKPLASLPQEKYPVHQAILFSLARLGDKSCKECEDKLTQQIERDEKAVRLPGARGLVAETRVTLAIIQTADPATVAARAATAKEPAPEVVAEAGKGKGKGGKAAKGKPAKGKGKGGKTRK